MKYFVFLFFSIFLLNFISAGELKVTEEHPFLINGEWVSASDLKVGDELTLVNGSKVKITKLTDVETEEPFLVYNLEAGKYHNFVVGEEGVVVHNSDRMKKVGIWFDLDRKVMVNGNPTKLKEVMVRGGKIIGSGRKGTNPLAVFERMADEGDQIRNLWVTPITDPSKMSKELLELYTINTKGGKVGLLVFDIPEEVYRSGRFINNPSDAFNYLKMYSWQRGSSIIRVTKNMPFNVPANAVAKEILVSELGNVWNPTSLSRVIIYYSMVGAEVATITFLAPGTYYSMFVDPNMGTLEASKHIYGNAADYVEETLGIKEKVLLAEND